VGRGWGVGVCVLGRGGGQEGFAGIGMQASARERYQSTVCDRSGQTAVAAPNPLKGRVVGLAFTGRTPCRPQPHCRGKVTQHGQCPRGSAAAVPVDAGVPGSDSRTDSGVPWRPAGQVLRGGHRGAGRRHLHRRPVGRMHPGGFPASPPPPPPAHSTLWCVCHHCPHPAAAPLPCPCFLMLC
jgi:hypothetical protein